MEQRGERSLDLKPVCQKRTSVAGMIIRRRVRNLYLLENNSTVYARNKYPANSPMYFSVDNWFASFFSFFLFQTKREKGGANRIF